MFCAGQSGGKAPMWGLLAVLCFLLWSSAAESRTWRVEKGGSGDFTVIQDAVDAAASGDTIRVGPGRFADYRTYVYAGNNWHVYANVLLGSLTIIGSGEGVTFIGADTPGTWGLGANAIGLLFWPPNSGHTLHVAAVTFSDTNYGTYVQAGTCAFELCGFVRVWAGVWALTSGIVRASRFVDVSNTGIFGVNPATWFVVDGCSFLNCHGTFNFQLVAAVTVAACEIQGCGSTGLFDRSAGSMRNCEVQGVPLTGYGLEVYGPGSYTIADNSFDGGGFNIVLALGASNVVCERNVFSGSRDEAVNITGCTPRFRNNHILKHGGVAVRVGGFMQPPDMTIDMSGNYWGTTSADSISAWIIDGNDPVVPPYLPIHGFVNFEPFSSVPVPTEKKSVGNVKAMFR